MEKQNSKKFVLVGLVLCMLCLFAIPTMKAKADTLESQVVQTVAFGEFDTINVKYEDPIVLKVVMKEKGGFVLDFSPETFLNIKGQLYDENSNMIGTWDYISEGCMSAINLEPGTYYVRIWADLQRHAGAYTYFARQIPSDDVCLELCVTLKKGKSVQLGTIFSNSNDKKVKWSSSKKTVATVSSTGKVTAKKKGTAVIKVYNSSGLVAKLKVKVIS